MSLNLEQQRKRAKDLRRAHQDQNLDAAVRIIRHLPRARNASPEQILSAPFVLSEAQFVVAREAGFLSWPDLRRGFDGEESLIDAALAGDDRAVDEILARDRCRSIYSAVCVADADAVAALLAADPTLADRAGGRRGWKPLLYLCSSRYRRVARDGARVAIARRLLESGAAVSGREPGFQSTHGTMLSDANELFAVEAAAGRAASPDLVRFLLSAGADLSQTTVALLQAVRGGSIQVLQILLQALPASMFWQVGWALHESVVRERKDMTRLLAAHADLPAEGALIEAVKLGSDVEMLEIVASGDRPHRHRALQNAYRNAIRYGRKEAAAWLLQHGADAGQVTATDRVLGACMEGDREALRKLPLTDDDHRVLSWAIRTGRRIAVPLLLEGGLDPNIPDTDGETPLHLAVRAGDLETVQLLIRSGAKVNARNFDAKTPLEISPTEIFTRCLLEAGASAAPGTVEPEDFERAADAVVSGDLAALQQLLDDEPSLVEARSPRPHRATLLHYCGANGVEEERQRTPANAPEITQLLLDRGADVNATCNLYRGGATTLGLMLSSVYPLRAGLRTKLLEVLVNAGAMLDGARGIAGLSGAAALGRVDLVEAFFRTQKPQPDQIQSAFFLACEFDRISVAAFLLDHGANIRAQNGNGQTGLHLATLAANLDTVALLLQRKAPLEIENGWGATVLNHALWAAAHHDPNADYAPIVKALIHAGAKIQPGAKPHIEALLI